MLVFSRILLIVAGTLLLLIGAGILFAPHSFFATNGIMLGREPSLMSEIRAPGGLLIGCAVVMLIGVAQRSLMRPALILAAIAYGTYGISRLFSLAIDGIPNSSLIGAAVLELVIGVLCVVPLLGLPSESSIRTSGREASWN